MQVGVQRQQGAAQGVTGPPGARAGQRARGFDRALGERAAVPSGRAAPRRRAGAPAGPATADHPGTPRPARAPRLAPPPPHRSAGSAGYPHRLTERQDLDDVSLRVGQLANPGRQQLAQPRRQLNSPDHRQIPVTWCNRLASSSASTSCRRYSALPWVMVNSLRAAAVSTGPPRVASSKVAVSTADSGCSSSRGRCPSFHSASPRRARSLRCAMSAPPSLPGVAPAGGPASRTAHRAGGRRPPRRSPRPARHRPAMRRWPGAPAGPDPVPQPPASPRTHPAAAPPRRGRGHRPPGRRTALLSRGQCLPGSDRGAARQPRAPRRPRLAQSTAQVHPADVPTAPAAPDPAATAPPAGRPCPSPARRRGRASCRYSRRRAAGADRR